MKPLAVVIPSKTASNLVACIAAVRQHEPEARIIVVDDGVDWQAVRNAGGLWSILTDANVQIFRGISPFVFARNVNIGICATGDADVVLLNDDALLESPCGFSLMQQAAEEHPEVGLVGATCNNVGNVNQWRKNVGLRFDPRMVCFVTVLIPNRTIEAVGLLDEEFTGYGFEDDSYCVRVRRAGLKIGIHDGCFMNHGKLPSTYRSPGGPGGDLAPNAEVFRKKYGASNKEV